MVKRSSTGFSTGEQKMQQVLTAPFYVSTTDLYWLLCRAASLRSMLRALMCDKNNHVFNKILTVKEALRFAAV